MIALLNWLFPFKAFLSSPFEPASTPPAAGPSIAQPSDGRAVDSSSPKGGVTIGSPDHGAPEPEGPQASVDLEPIEGLPEPEESEPEEEIAGAEPPRSTLSQIQTSERNRQADRPWLSQLFEDETERESGPSEVESEPPVVEVPSSSSALPADERESNIRHQEVQPIDSGFQQGIVVSVTYLDPSGPRMRGELSLPQLPTEALLSQAPGKRLIVRVRVGRDGRATVEGMDGSWLPDGVQQRVREHLERRPWLPKSDSSGLPIESTAAVIFIWKKK